MNDHRKRATKLPGNTKPDVDPSQLPGDAEGAKGEFVRRLAHVRGKYGRDQIRAVSLTGWEHFGIDLDRLDGVAAEVELQRLIREDKKQKPMHTTLPIGTMLYGYCGGHFGRDSYSDKRVEAVGVDWVVVRQEDGAPDFASDPKIHAILADFTTPEPEESR